MKLIKTDKYLLLIDEKADLGINKSFWGYCWNWWDQIHFFKQGLRENASGRGRIQLIIAYYPLTSEAKPLDGISLLPNPFEDKWEWYNNIQNTGWEPISPSEMDAIIAHGLKPQPEFRKNYKQFSLEDIRKAIEMAREVYWDTDNNGFSLNTEGDWSSKHTESDIIQSLSNKLPKEFIPELEKQCSCPCHQPEVMMTHIKACCHPGSLITKHINGKRQLIGEYKY